jgi:6-phosphogluconolactonase (cycloisomerase 2 family)
MRKRYPVVALVGIVLGGCAERDPTAPEQPSDIEPAFSTSGGGNAGAVYTMTNSAAGNQVLVFPRRANGRLGSPAAYATGGAGTGSGLGSQGALILTDNGRWLLAVNAGSDDVTVFRVGHSGVTLTDRVGSGGDRPISVTAHGELVYVLNAGGASNITGFTLSSRGDLSPIEGSTRPLSTAAPDPAQLAFDPRGRQIVVTEKATNRILTYEVHGDGTVAPAIVHASAGMTPFGFTFSRNRLIVSEAFGGAPNASATSSYILSRGDVDVVSASVGTTETAACWAVVTNNGRFAYVTNTGSGSVSGYRVASNGSLTLLDGDGVTGVTGAGSAPIDAALSVNSRFLYVLNAGSHTISAFRVKSDGRLKSLTVESGLPAGSIGLAAH